MIRIVLRLFLLAYFVMPIVSGSLVVLTLAQIRNDVTPIVETARTTISDATSALGNELRNLGSNFAPLVNAVNAIRGALQTVINFLRDIVYTLIDVVNGMNLACSIGGAACIPKSLNVTLPTIIDLSFMDRISANITSVTDELNTVVTTTTSAIASYTSMIALAVLVFVAWMLLTYLLFIVFLYTGLWGRTFAKAR